MADRFKRTGDAIGAGLRCLPGVGDPGHQAAGELAGGMVVILRARLGPRERQFLAASALMALPRDARLALIDAAMKDEGGNCPAVPFINVLADAREWAEFASTGERRAYMGAIWRTLPQHERHGFLDAIGVRLETAA